MRAICAMHLQTHSVPEMTSIPRVLSEPWHITTVLSKDHETALSAVRNLNGQELGGRPLRIDLADSDPFLEGKTTVRGEIIDGGETRAQWRERERERERHFDPRDTPVRNADPNGFLQTLPPGVPIPLGATALDTISQVLATSNPTQILEVLAQMKVRDDALSYTADF